MVKPILPDTTELLRQMQTGERTAVAIVEEHLQRLEANPLCLNAAETEILIYGRTNNSLDETRTAGAHHQRVLWCASRSRHSLGRSAKRAPLPSHRLGCSLKN